MLGFMPATSTLTLLAPSHACAGMDCQVEADEGRNCTVTAPEAQDGAL